MTRIVNRIGLLIPLFLALHADAEPSRRWLGDRRLAPEVFASVDGAARKLGDPGCRVLAEEFRDAAARPLSAELEARGLGFDSYLATLYFASGEHTPRCESRLTLAYTTPKSRVVWLCQSRLAAVQRTDPELAAFVVIHESLHTLGLEEDMTSSLEITDAVARRCRR